MVCVDAAAFLRALSEVDRNEVLVAGLEYLAGQTANGGLLSPEVFLASLPFRAAVFVEIFHLYREPDGKYSFLLAQRPDNDPEWPGQFTSTGKFLRRGWGRADVDQAVSMADEAGVRYNEPLYFAGVLNSVSKERGQGIILMYVRVVQHKTEPAARTAWIREDQMDDFPVMAGQREVMFPMILRFLADCIPQEQEELTRYA
jgi:hypothetical protein